MSPHQIKGTVRQLSETVLIGFDEAPRDLARLSLTHHVSSSVCVRTSVGGALASEAIEQRWGARRTGTL